MNWQKDLENRVLKQEPLKAYTTFKIGGPAEFLAKPANAGQLKAIIRSKPKRLCLRVIGAGSNLLVSDKGLKGVIVKLDAPYFKKIHLEGKNKVWAGAGVLLNRFVLFCQSHGLKGAEFLAGIPGTIGGALAMNAGIAIKSNDKKARIKNLAIGDLVEIVRVMDYNGKIKEFNMRDIKFGYRCSRFSRYIVLNAGFKLRTGDKDLVLRRIRQYLLKRRKTQDYTHPSAGCVFKNPTGNSAGRLIDQSGLKGKQIGDAAVSCRHANFLINRGDASAKDMLSLMELVKREVKKKYNIVLKPEIKVWK